MFKVQPPKLSDLINDCEKIKPSMNFAMFHFGSTWVCGDRAEYEGDWIIRAEGNTPEEAVLKLWIELNKKEFIK